MRIFYPACMSARVEEAVKESAITELQREVLRTLDAIFLAQNVNIL